MTSILAVVSITPSPFSPYLWPHGTGALFLAQTGQWDPTGKAMSWVLELLSPRSLGLPVCEFPSLGLRWWALQWQPSLALEPSAGLPASFPWFPPYHCVFSTFSSEQQDKLYSYLSGSSQKNLLSTQYVYQLFLMMNTLVSPILEIPPRSER